MKFSAAFVLTLISTALAMPASLDARKNATTPQPQPTPVEEHEHESEETNSQCPNSSTTYCCTNAPMNEQGNANNLLPALLPPLPLNCIASSLLAAACNQTTICCNNEGDGDQVCANNNGATIQIPVMVDILKL